MFQVQPLTTPETVPVDGAVFTLTHSMETLHVNPRSPDAAIELRKMKGFINSSTGVFQDWGPHQVLTLDAQGFADLMASTAGGKRAGDFKLSDIPAAITARQAAIQAAKDAAAAQAKP